MANNDNKHRRSMSMLLYIAVAIFVYLLLSNTLLPGLLRQQIQTVSYSEFLNKIESNEVTKVDLNTGNRNIRFTTGSGDSEKIFETTQFPNDSTLVQTLREHKVDFSASIPDNSANMLMYALIQYGIPLIIFLGIGFFINRSLKRAMGDDGPSMNFGGGFGGLGGNLGRSSAKEIKGEDTGITFKDVAGQEEAKESMQEIVSFLKTPDKYKEIGARCPRGALLVGPPGTGKTLIAKAVAGEAGVPFFQIAGSEFVEMFVGRGAAKVRDLFKQANEKAPCIIFIDEIDAVGKRRDASLNSNDEREQTLNQLLSEMDGFDNHKGIVVLAATNRPETLDKALLRPGRFDRRIPVELPDLKGREAVLQIHANDVKMEPGVDLSIVAKSTPEHLVQTLQTSSMRQLFVLFALVAVVLPLKTLQSLSTSLLPEQKRKIVFYLSMRRMLLPITRPATQLLVPSRKTMLLSPRLLLFLVLAEPLALPCRLRTMSVI